MTADDRDPLDLLAEEFADRVRKGERPSIDDYCRRHPELASDLRDVLPAVAQMELLKKGRRVTGAEPPPTRLGDFRIVREIGRGGMGVVYEAVQQSLGRRVALKLLPGHARLDPSKRERFLREAQAAARLHHTNIVPVFGVGEENGTPYYVMQYIPGIGLHDLLADWQSGAKPVGGSKLPRPRQWRAVARLGQAAAEALHEAHESGILHRDVKPANLLLDPRGHLWVTDFGLAKLIDSDTLTATGQVVGTIPYMAPEAFRGIADARTDVYGLGMTLYQLVTRRLPFDDSNPAGLIRQIETEQPPPPREIDSGVPRDLETILLTAIAREPGRRYQSAGDLADDLAAFLADRPIRARRQTWLDRGWRWCRRNPWVASLSAVLALVLGSAAGFGWAMYAKAERARAVEVQERKKAEEAEAKLADNLRLSLIALEQVLDAVAKTPQLPGPNGGPPRQPNGMPPFGPGDRGGDPAAVLEAVLTFYDTFAERNATHPKMRFDAAKAYRRVGELHWLMGRHEKANPAFLRSATMFDALTAELPGAADVQREFVLSVARLPPLPPGDPGFDARLTLFRRATAAADELRGRSEPLPPQPLAQLYTNAAKMLRAAGDREAARIAEEKAGEENRRPPRRKD